MRQFAMIIALSALLGLSLPASADWDDVAQSPLPAPPQPKPQPLFKAPVVETDEEFNQRKVTTQQLMARVRMQQMGLLREAFTPKQAAAPIPENMPIPGTPTYKDAGVFSNTADSSFFGGITRQQAAAALQMPVEKKFNPAEVSPQWAKQKYEVRQFRDDVERYGNEDANGFFR